MGWSAVGIASDTCTDVSMARTPAKQYQPRLLPRILGKISEATRILTQKRGISLGPRNASKPCGVSCAKARLSTAEEEDMALCKAILTSGLSNEKANTYLSR
jgi:hypothetical protein